MVGLLMWKKTKGGPGRGEGARRTVLGLPMAVVTVENPGRGSELFLRRRVRKACKRMRRLGVRQVILPKDFRFSTVVEETGLQPVPTEPLRQRLAAKLVEAALADRGVTGSCVEIAVSAVRLTGEVVRTVTELCLRYRYVTLSVPGGGGALAERLRREYGVALRLEPPGKGAAAAVYFDPDPVGEASPVCLRLWEPGRWEEVLLPPEQEAELPPEADRGQLLSALVQAGAVSAGQLRVGRGGYGNGKKVYDLSKIAALDNSQTTPYNTKL